MTKSIYGDGFDWRNTRIDPVPPGGRILPSATAPSPPPVIDLSENEQLLQTLEAHAVALIKLGLAVVLLDKHGQVIPVRDSFNVAMEAFTTSAALHVRCTPNVASVGFVASGLVRVRGPLVAMDSVGDALFAKTAHIVHDHNDATRFFAKPSALLDLRPRHATVAGFDCDVNLVTHIDVLGSDFRVPRGEPFAQCPSWIVDALVMGERK